MILTSWLASCRLCRIASCWLTINQDHGARTMCELGVRSQTSHHLRLLHLCGELVAVAKVWLLERLAAATSCGCLEAAAVNFVQILRSKLLDYLTFILMFFLGQSADLLLNSGG